MNKIKGVYNGYELIDGRKFMLAETGNNIYKLGILNKDGKWNLTERIFTRVRDYKKYLEIIEAKTALDNRIYPKL